VNAYAALPVTDVSRFFPQTIALGATFDGKLAFEVATAMISMT